MNCDNNFNRTPINDGASSRLACPCMCVVQSAELRSTCVVKCTLCRCRRPGSTPRKSVGKYAGHHRQTERHLSTPHSHLGLRLGAPHSADAGFVFLGPWSSTQHAEGRAQAGKPLHDNTHVTHTHSLTCFRDFSNSPVLHSSAPAQPNNQHMPTAHRRYVALRESPTHRRKRYQARGHRLIPAGVLRSEDDGQSRAG